ncbi:hypothetical protein EMIHUDRAFT_70204, partial [Emiliania huxleyi CCMP1516]|uniref:J domain-containing protein n=3 Tax=Emiliania huxleyi TaxID=2903 RepID=A0A0D3KS51_EMIH1
MNPTNAAQALLKSLDDLIEFRPGTKWAKAVERILEASDHYAVLGLTPEAVSADPSAPKQKYKRLALEVHPDKNKAGGAEAAFKKLNEAHETLSDSKKRREYD